MTIARPAGTYPAGPALLKFLPSRGRLFAAAGVLAAVNAQADQIIPTLTFASTFEALTGLAGISAVIWLSMYAAWAIACESGRSVTGIRDLAVLTAIVALSFLPISIAAEGALLLCGAYLFITSATADAERRAALVLLALTGPLIWGHQILHLFQGPILSFDAHIVGAMLGSSVNGNMVQFADGSSQFIIGAPCSSVHNISLAIVLWTTAAMLFRIRIDSRYAIVGAAMVAFMFGLNIVRLASIGLMPGKFDFLHTGTGSILFGWAGLIGACLLAGYGIVDAAERQR